MDRQTNAPKATRTAVCTAMAAILVAGCASSNHVAVQSSAPDTRIDKATAKSLTKAERIVAKSPQEAYARTALANEYLMAGRFESAVTTFEDARYLGDESARTALSLALAHAGTGNNATAVALLDQYSSQLPATDYGLALALAGETSRGVDLLADAMREGDDSAKLRQNLAYAYALDGRWREARVMAAQDVPADQLDARISDWARQGRPDDFRTRVASLLGAPVIADEGQPIQLALVRGPAEAPVAVAAVQTDSTGELPPVEEGESFWLAEATRPEVEDYAVAAPVVPEQHYAAAPPAAVRAPAAAAQSEFSQAFAEPEADSQFVAKPMVQKVPERVAAATATPQRSRKSRDVAPERSLVPSRVKAAGSGSHLVQLGSFSSQRNAQAAWSIFLSRNPELQGFDRTISEAMVNGKKYWRVSAAGFDRGAARQMCSTVKRRGGGCIAWAASSPLPGAI